MSTGRYARGEETRQRIIDTTVEIFGRKGFADTSTRDIAAAAGINTPAIQYYFDSKLGLYTACLDQLTNRIWCRIGPAIEACHTVLSGSPALAHVIASASAVQDCLIDSFFSDADGLAIRRIKAWADAENADNMPNDLLKTRIGLPIFETFRALVDYTSSVPMDQIEVDLHASALLGTSMIFHLDRDHVFKMAGCAQSHEPFMAALKLVAQMHLAFALTGLSTR